MVDSQGFPIMSRNTLHGTHYPPIQQSTRLGKSWESEPTWTGRFLDFPASIFWSCFLARRSATQQLQQSFLHRREDDAADPCPNDTADPCDHGDAPRTDNDANPCGYGGEDATLPRQHCHSELWKWLRRWRCYGDAWGGCVTAFSWGGNVMIRKWYYLFSILMPSK